MAPVVQLKCAGCGVMFERSASEARRMEKRGALPYCKPDCVKKRNQGPDDQSKRCTACGEVKPLDAFARQANGLLGRTARCKECARAKLDREAQKARSHASYLKNREKIRARYEEFKDDPEYKARKREAARAWREKNLERDRRNSRAYGIRTKYGLTIEEYDVIMARGCAICHSHKGRVVGKRTPGQDPPPARLCIDHDHANGKVRDALCHNCNSGLGLFHDDPDLLRRAASYLETHRKPLTQMEMA